jgi:hypothetical protein
MTKYTYYKIHLKITDVENNKCNYVGMTTNFNVRKTTHKRNCINDNRREYNYPVYQYIRANGGWNAWCVEPLEIGEYDNRLEASKRERYWYELEGGELNYQVPARVKPEYMAGYYDINREQLLQYQNEYYAENKDKQQEYRAVNKEHYLQYQKDYYQRKKAAQN